MPAGVEDSSSLVLRPRFLPDGPRFLVLGVGEDEGMALLPETRSRPRSGGIASSPHDSSSRRRTLFFPYGRDARGPPFDPKRLRFTGRRDPRRRPSLLLRDTGGPRSRCRTAACSPIRPIRSEGHSSGSTAAATLWQRRAPPGPVRRSASLNDGRLVAVERYEPGTGFPFLGVTDISRNATARLTVPGGLEQHPVWSPDGDRIVFSAVHFSQEKARGRFDRRRPGAPAGRQGLFPMDWSLDGKLFLYVHLDQKARRADVACSP